MSNAEIIASTNLIILLEDEVFADFFNTFLSLPVFGQTPMYTVENSQWSLWPEIPSDTVAKYKGLLTWLEKYRLPFFCKTNLCFHYILCQELISFIKSPEGGEDLVDFWILAEKILSIDETDIEVRDYYLSLLLMLKATHLQEGSRVVTLCRMNIKSLLNLSIWHPNQTTSRREILSHMQKVALFKLQSYWLPNFYTHAKMAMAKEEACQGLMQEYETRLCSICCSHTGGLPLNMTIKKNDHFQKEYSSRKTKRKMWQLINPGSWFLEMDCEPDTNIVPPQERRPQEKVVKQMPPLRVASSKEKIINLPEKRSHSARKLSMKKKAKRHLHMEGLFETKFTTHLRIATPFTHYSSQVTMKRAIKQSLCIGYTHWALCADAYAGSPFRSHLKKQNLKVETQLLDLWQDLHHFLGVLMNNRKNGNAVFRHMLGNRICELYLNEQIGPPLPLKSQIIQGLKELLPYGNVNPWIPKAQKEICKILRPWYDEFLNEEDYCFLSFTTQNRLISSIRPKRDTISKEENILLCKRVQESLELSHALATTEKMDSMQWQKIATEDLRQGGSLQVELSPPMFLVDISKMSFEELCCKYPKIAIEKISDDYKTYCERAPHIDYPVEIVKEPKVVRLSLSRKMSVFKKSGLRKPSMRPRNMTEVLLNSQHVEYFREFLKERKAESPLDFLVAVQRIVIETNEKAYKSLLENLLKTFFQSDVSPEEILQCDAPLIREVANMRHVSTTMLLMLQSFIMKSVEEKWFKDYQELFPARPVETETQIQPSPRKPSRTATTHLQESQKRGWMKMINFIRSFCKYRRFMSDPNKRQEFEDFLHLEMQISKDNFSVSTNTSGRSALFPANVRNIEQENGEMTFVKRRIYGHRLITVNFAINDIYFFSEMEKFNDLVSSAQMLLVNRTYSENDVLLMRSKINIILKLFLHSDIPPKLRVNIPESQKDSIITAITEGHLDRSIFHGAIMSLFPVVMYFWKRYCAWKVITSYFQYLGKKVKERKGPPKTTYKYPPSTGEDQAILRFTLLRGIEWLRPQHREVTINSVQNSSSSNLTHSGLTLPTVQMCPVPG
ncbi:regulator of G-protein signaling protein-like [Otolemur garnettii]|uniref:regulator of G-protein signaling protein-like n=1 Tax=Otolemur garnettii TaxID=30611 RepID=UPI000644751A|nr:regulator of G-protein signaling protein-like [Otolemur garnettii]